MPAQPEYAHAPCLVTVAHPSRRTANSLNTFLNQDGLNTMQQKSGMPSLQLLPMLFNNSMNPLPRLESRINAKLWLRGTNAPAHHVLTPLCGKTDALPTAAKNCCHTYHLCVTRLA
jgi:hypothetical protein